MGGIGGKEGLALDSWDCFRIWSSLVLFIILWSELFISFSVLVNWKAS